MKNALVLPGRREFLAGLAAVPSRRARSGLYDPKLAVHTGIWVLEAQRRGVPPPMLAEEAFRSLRAAGYRRVELAAALVEPSVRQQTLDLLRRNGLEPAIVANSWAAGNSPQARDALLELARVMRDAGATALSIMPDFLEGERAAVEESLRRQAFDLACLAQELRSMGMDLLLHHGLGDMRENAWRWHCLTARSEPARLCVDLEWAARVGMDPLAALNEAGPRLASVHVRNSLRGVELPRLGRGDIDLPAAARLLRQMSYQGFLVVELLTVDPARSPAEALYSSRRYLQEVFGSRPGYLPVDMGPHVRARIP